jgi:hypothetical protein
MRVVYAIPLTDDHIVETYAQHRTQQRALLWLAWPMKIICALGLLALLALGVYGKIYVLIGLSAFFLPLLAIGPRFDYWYMRRRWRRHPQFNESLRFEAADSGLSFFTQKSSGIIQWSAYTSAVARPRGVLLYATKWEYYWLPDSAIAEGSAAEMRALLRSKLQVRDAV